jgi:hypothetical protein
LGGPDWELAEVDAFEWAGSTPGKGTAPDTGGVHQPSHIAHKVHLGLDAVHVASTIAEFYEWVHAARAAAAAAQATAGVGITEVMVGGHALAVHGGVIVGGASVLVPLGGLATIVLTFMELHKAFTTTQRIETQKGSPTA